MAHFSILNSIPISWLKVLLLLVLVIVLVLNKIICAIYSYHLVMGDFICTCLIAARENKVIFFV